MLKSTGLTLVLALVATGAYGANVPILEYRFEAGGGSVAVNTGSLGTPGNGGISGATFSSDVPLGTGFSAAFDGVNDTIAVSDAFNYGSALTIEAWIKPAALSGQRILWDDYGNPGVVFAMSGTSLQFSLSTVANPGPGISNFSGTLTTDVWQHVAAVYDGISMLLYVNGVATGPGISTSGVITDNGSFVAAIGSDNQTTTALNYAGRLDDFRMFDVALTPAQLANGHFAPAIPEPGHALLLLAGLAVLGARFLRQRSASVPIR